MTGCFLLDRQPSLRECLVKVGAKQNLKRRLAIPAPDVHYFRCIRIQPSLSKINQRLLMILRVHKLGSGTSFTEQKMNIFIHRNAIIKSEELLLCVCTTLCTYHLLSVAHSQSVFINSAMSTQVITHQCCVKSTTLCTTFTVHINGRKQPRKNVHSRCVCVSDSC